MIDGWLCDLVSVLREGLLDYLINQGLLDRAEDGAVTAHDVIIEFGMGKAQDMYSFGGAVVAALQSSQVRCSRTAVSIW